MGCIDVAYFPLHGRCEPLMLMLTATKAEHKRTVVEDWPAGADELEFRGLPQFTWKGKKHGQTKAVLRSVGMAKGLYDTKDPMCCYHADVTVESFDGIFAAGGKVLFAADDATRDAAKLNMKALMTDFLTFHEDRMKKNNWTHSAGNKRSIADCIITCAYYTQCSEAMGAKLGLSQACFDEKFPCLKKVATAMEPTLKTYLDSRKWL
jgi:hypothetical protein